MMKSIKSLAIAALITAAFSVGANAQIKKGTDSLKNCAPARTSCLQGVVERPAKGNSETKPSKAKAARIAFVASLNNDQKAIMKDKTLTHKERKAKLAGTFTQQQKDAMAANKAAHKADRKAFVATLTEDQKSAFKKMAKERHGQHGFHQQKAQKA